MKKSKGIKKVIVAVSGGVDSSVAAALLKRAGFLVGAVHFRFFKNGGKTERRARAVAKKLGIGFRVLDLRNEFQKKVIDYFLSEYKQGRTPNPCVVCNKEMKFKALFDEMKRVKADFIATGHYARKRISADNEFANSKLIRYSLMTAKDKSKDQTYFLWRLGQKELRRTLFPVGDYTKQEARALAKKFGLPTASTPESQEVCFIKTTTFDFLKKHLGQNSGKIINEVHPRCIRIQAGKHQGLWFYTIGQRKGIGLPGGPYYVVGKDLKKNALVVNKNKKDLKQKEVLLKQVNWIAGPPPRQRRGGGLGRGDEPCFRVQVKIRSNAPAVPAAMFCNRITKHWKMVFDRPQTGVAPGQSAVFYWRGELLAGGVIV